jgi:nucleotide-binding universal stress UspA family protein
MIRSMLVPIGGAATDAGSLDAAVALARRFKAHLDVLHVRADPAEVVRAMGDMSAGVASARLMETLEATAAERESAAKQLFERVRAGERLEATPSSATSPVATLSWLGEVGDEASWVIRYGRTVDLLVIGRPAPEVTADTLESALLESGRPIYIPGALTGDLDTVAIAWKATREAALAVTAAEPFLATARRAIVLTAGEDGEADQDDAARLVSSLRQRGLVAEARYLVADKREPGARLLAAAAETNAGLLVMGGYGHNRLREWIFGGVTDMVLRSAAVPVLMAH